MKSIETRCKGYLFRSRLEARWAVLFDGLGVDWEYEPEGYALKNGMWYLPDFLLHNVILGGEAGGDLLVEVKGHMTSKDAAKIRGFSSEGKRILVLGRIPGGRFLDEIRAEVCGPLPGVDLQGRFRLFEGDFDGLDIARTVAAYQKARQARFEHGEGRF